MNSPVESPSHPATDRWVSLKWVYFSYLAAVGLMVTYWPLWMKSLGISETSIGLLFSVRTLIAVVAQPLLTMLADRLGRPVLVLRSVLLVVLLLGAFLPGVETFFWIAVIVWLQAPGEAASLPLIDSTVLRRASPEQFARVRVFGSLGYGVAVGAFGLAFMSIDEGRAGWFALFGFLMFYVSAFGGSLFIQEPPVAAPVAGSEGSLAPKIEYGRPLAVFLLLSALHYASIAMYNNLLSLHGASHGYSSGVMGAAVAVAVTAEIVLFRFAREILPRYQARTWFILVFVLGMARWLLTAWSPSPVVFVAAQALHFFGFGVWFTLSMRVLGSFGPPARRATLQGIFSAAVLAGGSVAGSGLGGWLMERYTGSGTFMAAAALELLALLVLLGMNRSTLERA
jgi:MFS transporter, PPP family, 3-phenylpropionic acid transporter